MVTGSANQTFPTTPVTRADSAEVITGLIGEGKDLINLVRDQLSESKFHLIKPIRKQRLL